MSEKRMSRSPLVANFPMEFSLVPLENLKKTAGVSTDHRYCKAIEWPLHLRLE